MSPRLLEAHDLPIGIDADEPRADVDRGDRRPPRRLRHTAIFAVPPPTSTFITVASSRIERATAPEPYAASTVSRLSPALTATNLPACAAKSSPIARALLRRDRDAGEDQRAGVDLLGIDLAPSYCLAMKAPSASASMSYRRRRG